MIKVCPNPAYWAGIYEKLLQHHEKNGGTWEDAPPMGLAFDGWIWTSDVEKHARWIEMQEWAAQYGCAELTEEVPDHAWYCVAEMSDRVQDPFKEGL